jgi:5-methylcytosine-specific restriction endonuclease McrA
MLRRRVLAEEDVCGICGEPVDKSLPHGLPGSPEVDEIIPVSKGGSPFERANTRLVHRLCNQRRGNGDRAVPRYVEPFETTRRW